MAAFASDQKGEYGWKAALLLVLFVGYIPVAVNAMEMYLGLALHQTQLDSSEQPGINPQSSGQDLEPSLGIASFNNYWGKSAAGYYVEFGVDTYSVEDYTATELDGSRIVHTSTSGEYAYLIPFVFYDFNKGGSPDWAFQMGIGAGVNYMTVKGTVIVNRSSGSNVERVDDSTFGYATGLIFKFGYKDLAVVLKHFIPEGNIDGIEMELQLTTLAVGYKFDM